MSAENSLEPDSGKVLIVDDEIFLRDIWAEIFSMLNQGYILAASADEGIACIKRQSPLLLITDLLMPGSSGIDVLEYLKKRPAGRIPVFVCSGYLENGENELSRFAIERVIPKPFSVKDELTYFRRFLDALSD